MTSLERVKALAEECNDPFLARRKYENIGDCEEGIIWKQRWLELKNMLFHELDDAV